MTRPALFKGKLSLFAITIAIFSFFISCSNLVSDNFDNQSSASSGKSESLVYFTGAIDASLQQSSSSLEKIALPKAQKTENSTRTAIPDFINSSTLSSQYEYFVNAQTADGSLSAEGSVDASLNYSIGLKAGYKWEVTAGIRNTDTLQIIMSDSYEVTINAETAASTKNMILKPATSGSGSVSLTLSVDSSIKKVSVELAGASYNFEVSGGSTSIDIPSVAAGAHNATISFLDDSSPALVLYSIKQVINVFAGVSTNTWFIGGISKTSMNISSSEIESQKRTIFYVAEGKVHEGDKFHEAAEENDGSAYYPLPTITSALQKIAANAKDDADYFIYVTGTVNDNVNLNTDSMNSLTIQNVSGSTATIDGDTDGDGSGNGSVFTVDTSKTVILHGLTITKGSAKQGGGIHMLKGSLEVKDCKLMNNHAVVISGAGGSGGAVYVPTDSAITLCKFESCQISNNTAKDGAGFQIMAQQGSHASAENCIFESNIAINEGGAIKVTSGKYFTVTNCQIKNNEAEDGGGIYITGTARLTMGGTSISGNTATNGGGIYNASTHTSLSADDILLDDIYLPKGIKLLLPEVLTKQTEKIIITPETLAAGIQILDGAALSTEYTKFALSDAGYKIKSNGKIAVANPLSELYVSETGSDSNSGKTVEDAFATIKKALQVITLQKEEETDYTIHVSGTLKGTNEIPASNTTDMITIDSTTATSITIDGSAAESGGTNAILDGNGSTSSAVLHVSTAVPVTLTKLTITNGACHGLQVGTQGASESDDKAIVKLGNGVIISGNSTTENGGGVCIEPNGELYMYSNAIIGQVETSVSDSSNYSNYASGLGGGIYCNGGKLYIGYTASTSQDSSFEGGIYYNYADNSGGGIYTEGNALVYFAKGYINYNSCKVSGGGIRCGGTDTVNILGGEIKGNDAGSSSYSGGGIYLGGSSTLNLSGGLISQNTASSGGAIYNNGGVLNITASAYIPVGDDGKNEIELAIKGGINAKITVAGSLTPPEEANGIVATIHPNPYSEGETILEAGSGVTLANEVSKFKIRLQNRTGQTNPQGWSIADDGTLKADITETIVNMIESGTVTLSGSLSDSQFSEIKSALSTLYSKDSSIKVTLDISATTVTSIPYNAFRSSANLEGIVFPETLTTIGDWAFMECSSLNNVVLPASTINFAGHPFQKCTSLTSISIPEGATTVGREGYLGCTSLANVDLPQSLTKLEARAFKYCRALTSITIPNKVTLIEGEAFYECENLTEIIFEGTTEEWEAIVKESEWNYNCPATVTCTKDVTADNVAETISSMTESGTVKVRGEISGDTIYNIKDALSGLGSDILVDLDLSATTGLTAVATGCFSNHTHLSSVELPDTITSVSANAFINCSNLVSVVLPSNIDRINMGTFTSCSSLTSIEIPAAVTMIGMESFEGCSSLVTVTIPVSVSEIDTNAFKDCTALTTINYAGTTTQWASIDLEESDNYQWNKGCNAISVICTDGTVNVPAVP